MADARMWKKFLEYHRANPPPADFFKRCPFCAQLECVCTEEDWKYLREDAEMLSRTNGWGCI